MKALVFGKTVQKEHYLFHCPGRYLIFKVTQTTSQSLFLARQDTAVNERLSCEDSQDNGHESTKPSS